MRKPYLLVQGDRGVVDGRRQLGMGEVGPAAAERGAVRKGPIGVIIRDIAERQTEIDPILIIPYVIVQGIVSIQVDVAPHYISRSKPRIPRDSRHLRGARVSPSCVHRHWSVGYIDNIVTIKSAASVDKRPNNITKPVTPFIITHKGLQLTLAGGPSHTHMRIIALRG